jgi:hypothetical protein
MISSKSFLRTSLENSNYQAHHLSSHNHRNPSANHRARPSTLAPGCLEMGEHHPCTRRSASLARLPKDANGPAYAPPTSSPIALWLSSGFPFVLTSKTLVLARSSRNTGIKPSCRPLQICLQLFGIPYHIDYLHPRCQGYPLPLMSLPTLR